MQDDPGKARCQRRGHGRQRPRFQSRPVLESLEHRSLLTNIVINHGTTAALVSAIETCNASGAASNYIELKGTYVIQRPNNDWFGPNGLPPIACNL